MTQDRWSIEIEGMPHFEMAMKRIDAWYENQIIDRPPVRFIAHNAFLETAKQDISNYTRQEKETWWFDAELQVDLFVRSIAGQRFHGETFPVFFPNLGPDVYAAFYGAQLIFGDVTSWSVPLVERMGSDGSAPPGSGKYLFQEDRAADSGMPWSAVTGNSWSVIPICTQD